MTQNKVEMERSMEEGLENKIETSDAMDAAQEEYVSKAKVDEIVKRNRAAAAEKARREAEAQYMAEIEKYKSQQGQMGGMSAQPNYEEMRNKMRDDIMQDLQREAQKNAMKQDVDRAYSKYLEMMPKGAELYEDFNEVVDNFNPQEFPELVYYVSKYTDDPRGVMYELLKDPIKMSAINNYVLTAPRFAEMQIQKLDRSIKSNLEAKSNLKQAPQPLNQLRPSSTAGVKSGEPSLGDLKKAPQLRG